MKPINEQRGKPQAQAGEQQDKTSGMPGAQQATADQQEVYEKVILAGTEILFSDETNPQIMKMMQNQAQTPEKAIADVVFMLVTQLDDKSKGSIPEGVLFASLEELIEQTANLVNEAGVFPVDEALMNRAAQIVMDQVAEEYGITPEEAEEFMAAMGQEQGMEYAAQQRAYGNPGAPPPGAPPAGAQANG